MKEIDFDLMFEMDPRLREIRSLMNDPRMPPRKKKIGRLPVVVMMSPMLMKMPRWMKIEMMGGMAMMARVVPMGLC